MNSTTSGQRRIAARPPLAGANVGQSKTDAIAGLTISHIVIPLKFALSDAKVLTGRQSPLTHVDILAVEAVSEGGQRGMGFGYTLRAGGAGMHALACEIAPRIMGHDPNDIGRLWELLSWQVNSLGRGGMAYQTIAAFDVALWDMKARNACSNCSLVTLTRSPTSARMITILSRMIPI